MIRPSFLNNKFTSPLIYALVSTVLLSACQQEVAEPQERIRAVKTITVGEQASDALRKFPGTVEPVDTSNISFEVDGVIKEIRVEVGDRFKKGEVLAVLDKKPFELNVESARSASSRARAQFEEKQSAYDRERRIQAEDPGATTQKAVEQARAAYMSQRENVSYSEAQFKLAKRDLANTELRAPFAGTVSVRHMEASEVAARGQQVLGIYAEGAMQVAVSIPEQLIVGVRPGIEGQVLLANRPDDPYQAMVTEVGSAATSANAFPVKARISNADQWVRPGMTAELNLFFSDAATQSAYLLPVQAILFGVEKDDRYIFVFDPETSTVRKMAIQARGLRGNQAVVSEGIAPGDVIVVAGVNFLRDGQEVKLFNASEPDQ